MARSLFFPLSLGHAAPFLSLLLLCLSCKLAESNQYKSGCSLRSVPEQALVFDQDLGQYILLEDVEAPGENRQLRRGETSMHTARRKSVRRRREGEERSESGSVIALTESRSLRSLERTVPENDILYARECYCGAGFNKDQPGSTVYYCLAEFDTCGLPSDLEVPIGCFTLSSKMALIQNGTNLGCSSSDS